MSKQSVGSRPITAAAARLLKPGAERREIPDAGCPGLYLIVQPSGRKSWAVRYRRPNGRPTKLTLGSFTEEDAPGEPRIGAPLTLAAARQLATSAQRQRSQGHDPAAVRQREKQAARASVGVTYSALALRFIEEHARPKTRRWKETARILGFDPRSDLALIPRGVAQRWRDKPISDVTADDLHVLVREVEHHGVPGLERRTTGRTESRARATHAALSKLFAWLVAERLVAASPVVGVGKPAPAKARDRVLTDAEILAFWRACTDATPPGGTLLQFLLLVGCREKEASRMQPAELRPHGLWLIPSERAKNHRAHEVPLPPLALQLLEDAPRIEPRHFVFTTTGTTPFQGFGKLKARIDKAMQQELGDVPHWQIHDLRRTCASGMARAGVELHVIERCLNHMSGSFAGIVGVYQRHRYASEMKKAYETWQALLLEIVGA
jgi:integrase